MNIHVTFNHGDIHGDIHCDMHTGMTAWYVYIYSYIYVYMKDILTTIHLQNKRDGKQISCETPVNISYMYVYVCV